MKKKLAGMLLAGILAVQCVAVPGLAAEKDEVKFGENAGIRCGSMEEIWAGDRVTPKLGYLLYNGEFVENKEWDNASGEEYEARQEALGPYDYYIDDEGNKVEVDYDEPVPEAAFGKKLHSLWLIYYKPAGKIYPIDITSKSTVLAWPEETKVWSMKRNADKKTVRAYFLHMSSTYSEKLTVPKKATIAGKTYTVTAVGGETDGRDEVKELKLPETIKTITKKAFYESVNLKTVTMTGKVKSIGKKAFAKIAKKPVFKIKANKKDFNRVVKLIKESGAPKSAAYKRIG